MIFFAAFERYHLYALLPEVGSPQTSPPPIVESRGPGAHYWAQFGGNV
jgi:hypothetical protein